VGQKQKGPQQAGLWGCAGWQWDQLTPTFCISPKLLMKGPAIRGSFDIAV
jgi:hypothetical protein